MSEPSAKIIADSISEDGQRLTTFQVTFHRFVLAEFNTHCVLSRNSASSRARPVTRTLTEVLETPAYPLSWPAEQKGMQGGEELSGEVLDACKQAWTNASEYAAHNAQWLLERGLHKSVVNRLLEPFMMHTAVVTATAWQNFFVQRCSPLAQPEIKACAELMRSVYYTQDPHKRKIGEWHLPYIQVGEFDTIPIEDLAKISAARCARVSYLTQEGKRDPQEDLNLFERLTTASPMHASPLEHVARVEPSNVHEVDVKTTGGEVHTLTLPRYGKLLGWHSLRYDVECSQEYQSFA